MSEEMTDILSPQDLERIIKTFPEQKATHSVNIYNSKKLSLTEEDKILLIGDLALPETGISRAEFKLYNLPNEKLLERYQAQMGPQPKNFSYFIRSMYWDFHDGVQLKIESQKVKINYRSLGEKIPEYLKTIQDIVEKTGVHLSLNINGPYELLDQ